MVYPSNDIGSSGSGCLVIYNGMTDALRWAWTQPQDRVRLVLQDLDRAFRPQGVDVFSEFIEAFDAPWPSQDAGANTMYLPGQFSRYHEAMKRAEGHVHFAGEHISVHHTWIAGSTETAHEAVKQILGNDSLPRLGGSATSTLAGPVRFGWQVAEGLTGQRLGELPSRSPAPNRGATLDSEQLNLSLAAKDGKVKTAENGDSVLPADSGVVLD